MGIEAPGYVRAAEIFELSKEDRRSEEKSIEVESAAVKELNECCSTSSASSTTSSIGRNSDGVSSNKSSEGNDSGENEAQSAYNGPLDMMDALEEILPMRRGISKFYNGKSKSFTSLSDASSSSIKDIVKPENAYTRKRRNLMAFNQVWDKNRNLPRRSSCGVIAKRPINSSRSSLALAVSMGGSQSSSSISEDSNSSSTPRSPPHLPPRHPQARIARNSPASSPPQQNFSAWRSVSLFDLQRYTNGTANCGNDRLT